MEAVVRLARTVWGIGKAVEESLGGAGDGLVSTGRLWWDDADRGLGGLVNWESRAAQSLFVVGTCAETIHHVRLPACLVW